MDKKQIYMIVAVLIVLAFISKKSKAMSTTPESETGSDASARIIRKANLYKGIEEIGNNKAFNNAVFQKMMSEVGWKSGAQWCMYYATMIYVNALPELKADFRKSLGGSSQGSFNNVKKGLSKTLKVVTSGYAKVGDIVIWTNKSNPSFGHAGIVISVDGNKFQTIEGNANYNPAYSNQEELVGYGVHNTAIGATDNPLSGKTLRGFIRLK
jgi:hypothetical protein